MDALAGRRIHELLPTVAGSGAGPSDAVAAARKQARDLMETGTVMAGVRTRVSNGLSSYLRNFDPVGWTLLGHEMPLGGGVADLVWKTPAGIIVDEVKSGTLNPSDRGLTAQIGRFVDGGLGRWGEDFAGVRVLPLTTPRTAVFVTPDGDWVALPAAYLGKAT